LGLFFFDTFFGNALAAYFSKPVALKPTAMNLANIDLAAIAFF
jgi:hypothetical protein